MALGVMIRFVLLLALLFFVELSLLMVIAFGRHDLNRAELFFYLLF